jgi:hypothetical protein
VRASRAIIHLKNADRYSGVSCGRCAAIDLRYSFSVFGASRFSSGSSTHSEPLLFGGSMLVRVS